MTFSIIKKTVSPVAVVVALVATLTTAGTLAYLTDFEGALKNTFSIGNVSLTLEETDTALDDDGDALTNSYALTEGGQLKASIVKDPKVTVAAGSANCWLFVRITEGGLFDEYLDYEAADGWIALDEALHPDIFYREVPASDIDQAFSVLEGDAVSVNADTTLTELRALEKSAGPWPSLEVTAYAVQKGGVADAATAWSLIGEEGPKQQMA